MFNHFGFKISDKLSSKPAISSNCYTESGPYIDATSQLQILILIPSYQLLLKLKFVLIMIPLLKSMQMLIPMLILVQTLIPILTLMLILTPIKTLMPLLILIQTQMPILIPILRKFAWFCWRRDLLTVTIFLYKVGLVCTLNKAKLPHGITHKLYEKCLLRWLWQKNTKCVHVRLKRAQM